jgi:hypothetical protein
MTDTVAGAPRDARRAEIANKGSELRLVLQDLEAGKK